MKLSEYRKKSQEYTAKASEINRQLSLAGVAIIWLFKNSEEDGALFTPFLIWPLFFLTLSLLFDLIQYILGGIIWIRFFKQEEAKADNNTDPEIKAPNYMNKPIYFFYYSKILVMLFAYLFIISYVISKL